MFYPGTITYLIKVEMHLLLGESPTRRAFAKRYSHEFFLVRLLATTLLYMKGF